MSTRSSLELEFEDNRIHERWESAYRNHQQQNQLDDLLMDRILHHLQLPVGSRILDAGCGTGGHTLRLAKRGYRCVGVDFSAGVLERARQKVRSCALDSQVMFVRSCLEDLAIFSNNEFDAVHCRGVLMHIPRWQDALRELCRVLKPGGKIAILENNMHSLEMAIIRAVRLIRKGNSSLVKTPGGLEFYTSAQGEAPLTRYADIPCLIRELENNGVRKTARLASTFWDPNRFPAGVARNAAIAFNLLWFRLRLSASSSGGNILIGEIRNSCA